MGVMKLKVSGVGVKPAEQREGGYNGPALVGGTYVVRLKRMVHSLIGQSPTYTGQWKGYDRFNCMFEVVEPDQWKGAAIWEGINVIDPSMQFVNQFLHAIAGAETAAQQQAVEKAFYENLHTKAVENKKSGQDEDHVVRIGNLVQVDSPRGETLLRVVIRMEWNKARQKDEPKIVSYIAYDGSLPQPTVSSGDEATDLLGDMAQDLDEGVPASENGQVPHTVPDNGEPSQDLGDDGPPF